ncbi:hypothetical protein CMUST_15485 (plasmid) [Corynebacterium mustelae]|uniref:Uncharacterized protein n=1 Tax=Corynebacterium mustelae TaxID=571915 RepID=A0A0G3H1U7_9CORY|nr:hypothetical protein [Corynebacterium mustelae]AKK07386.1 hypothetical protein CMUST_15485 [Corynebacterium mustelae]
MGRKVGKDSSSLTARQRARAAIQVERDRFHEVENSLAEFFSLLDAREANEIAAGRVIAKLKALGESQKSIVTATGLTSREVTRLAAKYEDSTLISDGEKVSD